MIEHVPIAEKDLTAETVREVLDRMTPYITAGMLEPQLVSAPRGKLFLLESSRGMFLETKIGQTEVVHQFVCDTVYVRSSRLVANDARRGGVEIDNDDLILEARVLSEKLHMGGPRLVSDYKGVVFSFIDTQNSQVEAGPIGVEASV